MDHPIDLDTAPYSARFSRLFVLSSRGMARWSDRPSARGAAARGESKSVLPLTVLRAAYERPVARSVVADDLTLRRDGAEVPWTSGPDGVRFDSGARLIVTAGDHLVVTGLQAGDELHFLSSGPAEEEQLWKASAPSICGALGDGETGAGTVADGEADAEGGACGASPADAERRLYVEGPAVLSSDGAEVRARAEGAVSLRFDTVPADSEAGSPTTLAREHDQALTRWRAKSPHVTAARQPMVDLCWWVLGQNTLHLGENPEGASIVVPSRLGYVGLWQWDAYFIALGLRHGDRALARAQMDIALDHALPDGQLPDVVHDHGVLDSSRDLPAGDLETLRRLASPALEGRDVPLTKPPLTALTLVLLSGDLGGAVIDDHLETVLAAQRWWFTHSDPGSTGWPAYLHPYSSGLDDSPVFDDNAILRSPDLAAYLVLQDRILAGWLEQRGRAGESRICRERSDRLRSLLEERWDGERGLFVLAGENSDVDARTILNLIALLIPELRADIRDSLLDQITDPVRFGGTWSLATVARDDPSFSPERMWRGPIWVNTAWLVIRGLRTQGEDALADRMTSNVLDLVEHAGGPSEYFNPESGQKAETATVLFGWSAALFVDLAVAEAG